MCKSEECLRMVFGYFSVIAILGFDGLSACVAQK